MSQFIPPNDGGQEIINNTINASLQLAQQLGVNAATNALLRAGISNGNLNNPTKDLLSGYYNGRISMFGTPFIGGITFCLGGQQIVNSNDLSTPIFLPEVDINVCLMTIDLKKNIAKNSLLGRDGTIKTYINKSDYSIEINATILPTDDPSFKGNYQDIYPKTVVEKLIEIMEAECMINVTSDFLLMFGIDYVVIDDISVIQEEGIYAQQKITINCTSDNPISYQSIINPKFNNPT